MLWSEEGGVRLPIEKKKRGTPWLAASEKYIIISGFFTPPFCLPVRIWRVCSQTRSGRSGGHSGECRRSGEKKKQLQEWRAHAPHQQAAWDICKEKGKGIRRIPRLPCCHRQPLFCSFLPSQRQRRGGSSQESPTDTVKRWCSGDPCVCFFYL